jgi:hypothetical protein
MPMNEALFFSVKLLVYPMITGSKKRNSENSVSLHGMFASVDNFDKNFTFMGLLDFLFNSKEKREKEKRVKDVLKRTDDFIEQTEKMLDEMQKEDKRWRSGL